MGKYNRTMNVRHKMGPVGPEGMWIEVNNDIIMKYDFSSVYRINGNLVFDIKESYSPKVVDHKHIGIAELPDSLINICWYEKEANADIVVEAWKKYEEYIPLSKLTGYLIARDVILGKIYRYISVIPSWDVCITLPLYMKLCEDIPGFKERILKKTEVGDQIRGSAKNLDKHFKKCQLSPQLLNMLDDFLVKIHSLSDELELAYNIKKLGYDIKFGDAGQPDYFINDIPAEHKSRFPDVKSVTNMQDDSEFNYNQAMCELFSNISCGRRGLKKAEIYFTNVSRLVSSIKFHYVTEMTQYGPGEKYFNISDMFCDFSDMMSIIMGSHEKGKLIVPYMKPICSNPRIIVPLPIPEKVLDRILEGKRMRQ